MINLPQYLVNPARLLLADITQDLVAEGQEGLRSFELCERALFFTYLGRSEPERGWHGRAIDYLNAAISQLAEAHPVNLSLYGGLAGMGWIAEHCSTLMALDAPGDDEDEQDALCRIDDLLIAKSIGSSSLNGNYDLISGWIGLGLYFIERWPGGRSQEGLAQIIANLTASAEYSDEGVAWYTPAHLVPDSQRHMAPHGYYNLGMAHGNPGVIAFLCAAASVVTDEGLYESIMILLRGSISWLVLRQRASGNGSVFGSWEVPGFRPKDSRLGWCYGDLGIGMALIRAGQVLKDESVVLLAQKLLTRCASMTSREDIRDAGLCHGSFGVSHLFNVASRTFPSAIVSEAALRWFDDGLRHRTSGKGAGGIFAFRGDVQPPEQADSSFLGGAVGVGLTLISSLVPIVPAWDRLLLV